MKLGCTYIKVIDLEKSTYFYKHLTNTQPDYVTPKRWVSFPCGISLYALHYDLEQLNTKTASYNTAYLHYASTETAHASKNIVFNFETDDLLQERKRLIDLNLGKVSELMYVNLTSPYYFFIIEDPDGNEIEITGPIHQTSHSNALP